MRQDRRNERVMSDSERSRLRELRDSVAAEKDEILAEGRQHKIAHVAIGPGMPSVVRVGSPRLADPSQLDDFKKTVTPEIPNAEA